MILIALLLGQLTQFEALFDGTKRSNLLETLFAVPVGLFVSIQYVLSTIRAFSREVSVGFGFGKIKVQDLSNCVESKAELRCSKSAVVLEVVVVFVAGKFLSGGIFSIFSTFRLSIFSYSGHRFFEGFHEMVVVTSEEVVMVHFS